MSAKRSKLIPRSRMFRAFFAGSNSSSTIISYIRLKCRQRGETVELSRPHAKTALDLFVTGELARVSLSQALVDLRH